MIYGLDEYYSGLIEEAKSPEEIKKILEYQFVQGKGVPRHVFVDIFNIDPTKKKSYTRWVLSHMSNIIERFVRHFLTEGLKKCSRPSRKGLVKDLT